MYLYNIAIDVVNLDGLFSSYYDNTDLTDCVAARSSTIVDFSAVGSALPSNSLTDSSYSVRWEGYVKTESCSNFQLTTELTSVDDRVRLWVDNVILLDQWRSLSNITVHTEIVCEQTELRRLQLEYKSDTGSSGIRLLSTSSHSNTYVLSTARLLSSGKSSRNQISVLSAVVCNSRSTFWRLCCFILRSPLVFTGLLGLPDMLLGHAAFICRQMDG